MLEPEIGNIHDLNKERQRPIAPWVMVVLAMLYGVLPTDLIPDAVPLVGWVDDIGLLLAAVLHLVQKTGAVPQDFRWVLIRYLKWVVLVATLILILALGGLLALTIWMAQAVAALF